MDLNHETRQVELNTAEAAYFDRFPVIDSDEIPEVVVQLEEMIANYDTQEAVTSMKRPGVDQDAALQSIVRKRDWLSGKLEQLKGFAEVLGVDLITTEQTDND